jgi:hypothetical protein
VAGAHIAAAAAAQRKMRHEEEEMTSYRSDDLAGWEFKIVRSATHRFKEPAFMARALAEEARFGWELVEKFDNERMRLKRPLSARVQDNNLGPGLDPYRTEYGMSEAALGVSIAVAILLVMGIGIAIMSSFS